MSSQPASSLDQATPGDPLYELFDTLHLDDRVCPPQHPHTHCAQQDQVSLQHLLNHDSIVCSISYSRDGRYLASGSNCAAHVFDAKTGDQVSLFSDHVNLPRDDGTICHNYVRSVCFSPDSLALIEGGEDHVVRVWEARSGKLKNRLVGHTSSISSVDISSNNQFIVSGSEDTNVKLWSLATGNFLTTLAQDICPAAAVTSVSVSPTCQHIASASLDGIVRIWDVESRTVVRQLKGHSRAVYSVAFSPEGRAILSGSLDKTLRLSDLAASNQSSQCAATLTGHTDFVLCGVFSPDGRWLISGSKDRTVRMWDARQTRTGLQLLGHNSSIISIGHNPMSACFATACGDFQGRTWLYSI